MHTRQKILLLLVRLAGRPLSRDELAECCILLGSRPAIGRLSSFYEFVPTAQGPVSFTFEHELEKLRTSGELQTCGVDGWTAGPEGSAVSDDVPEEIACEVRSVANGLDGLSSTVSSGRAARRSASDGVLPPSSERHRAVFTAGYEGLSVDAFLGLLLGAGIDRLIDVRSNPTARRFGFHKSTLQRLLSRLGREYRHFGELGIKSEVRQLFDGAEERGKLLDRYERLTLESERAAIAQVANLVRERPSVLVCREADPTSCHRSRLAKPVSELTELPIIHLQPVKPPFRRRGADRSRSKR